MMVDLGEGDVDLKVPAGSYRCNFASDAGEVTRSGITCDDAAAAVLDVQVGRGDITVTAATL
ncbi:hypothetical protein [Nannocystis pusilla]|uniref:hypothetical protein n=1 Tax=Nannocystis pusilla TaxID=889268 RepID=UPI003B7A242C